MLMNTQQIVPKSSPMMDKSSRGCLNKPHYNWPQTRRGYNLEAIFANVATLSDFLNRVVPIWCPNSAPIWYNINEHSKNRAEIFPP